MDMPARVEPGSPGLDNSQATPITTPPPAAHRKTSSRAAQAYAPYEPDEKEATLQPYPQGRRLSPSSVANSSGTIDTIDIEKQAFESILYHREEPRSHRSSRQYPSPRHSQVSPSFHAGSEIYPPSEVRRIKQEYKEEDPAERASEMELSNNSVRLLLFFVFALPLLSFTLSIATLVITLVLTLLHPIRLIFTRKRTFSNVVLSVLAPLVNMHLEFIYASPVNPEQLLLGRTLLAMVAGCVLSIGIASWALILGIYWFFALIIGNPDGLDGRSEGREMVLTTRSKWLGWLMMAVRPEEDESAA